MRSRSTSCSARSSALLPPPFCRITPTATSRRSTTSGLWRQRPHRTRLFCVAGGEIAPGYATRSIDRLTVGTRNPSGQGRLHRVAGVTPRAGGEDRAAGRIAGHRPGDDVAVTIHLVELALCLGGDRVGSIDAGGAGHPGISPPLPPDARPPHGAGWRLHLLPRLA